MPIRCCSTGVQASVRTDRTAGCPRRWGSGQANGIIRQERRAAQSTDERSHFCCTSLDVSTSPMADRRVAVASRGSRNSSPEESASRRSPCCKIGALQRGLRVGGEQPRRLPSHGCIVHVRQQPTLALVRLGRQQTPPVLVPGVDVDGCRVVIDDKSPRHAAAAGRSTAWPSRRDRQTAAPVPPHPTWLRAPSPPK